VTSTNQLTVNSHTSLELEYDVWLSIPGNLIVL